MLEHVELEHELDVLQHYTKIDEIPFDFAAPPDVRRRASERRERSPDLQRRGRRGVRRLHAARRSADGVVPLDAELRADGASRRAKAATTRAFASSPWRTRRAGRRRDLYGVGDERDLVLAGFIAFLDPPKESAARGDRGPPGARRPRRRAHRRQRHRHAARVPRTSASTSIGVVARLGGREARRRGARGRRRARRRSSRSSTRRRRRAIIRALQGRGHTVGYLGDGINDAAALRDADVGISVDTATDIARESADIILLEKSLLVLETGVLRGREVYGNIIKYIKMTASSNFGNVFSVLIASAFLPFLPMLPVQLLDPEPALRLLAAVAAMGPHGSRSSSPSRASGTPSGIARFMVFIGPISSIFDVTTFLLLWFVFRANSARAAGAVPIRLVRRGPAVADAHRAHDPHEKIPFVQSTAALPVLLVTTAIMAVGMWVPFSHFGRGVRHGAAAMVVLPVAGRHAPGVLRVTQTVKTWYIRRFDTWL